MASFDGYAKIYDHDFSYSKIGLLQRQRVWAYLNKYLEKRSVLEILELSGGTGEDLKFFIEKGHQILYTDVSPNMLEKAQSKIQNSKNVEFQLLDLNNLSTLQLEKNFDLIFSNFGGLNCVDESRLNHLNQFANLHLKENGEMILVVMPRDTILDRLYRKWKNMPAISRSSSIPTKTNVEGGKVDTYYYNTKDIKTLLPNFEQYSKKVIGFFPSFFEQGFEKRPMVWSICKRVETLFSKFDGLSNYADHFLIHLKKKT